MSGNAPARVFQCPNCREYINTSLTECRFCHAPINPLMAQMAADQLSRQSDIESEGSRKDQGKRNMVVGALWCIGGTLVTVISYSMAASNSSGGSYIIAWGAIIFGAIQFFKGVFQYMAG